MGSSQSLPQRKFCLNKHRTALLLQLYGAYPFRLLVPEAVQVLARLSDNLADVFSCRHYLSSSASTPLPTLSEAAAAVLCK